MLHKIKPKPILPPKTAFKDKRSITISGLEPHTFDWFSEEAKARNMGNSEFGKHILELLESGDF